MRSGWGVVAIIGLALAGLAFWWWAPTGSSDAIVAEGGPIVEVTVPELSGQALIGERAFTAKCAACHGKNAAGQDGVAPPLVHKIYEPSHHGDAAFLLAARIGVRSHHWRFGNMPPVKDVTDAEIKTIIAYVRTLQQANGIR